MIAIAIRQASNHIAVLITVSLLTQPDPKEKWELFYEKEGDLDSVLEELE